LRPFPLQYGREIGEPRPGLAGAASPERSNAGSAPVGHSSNNPLSGDTLTFRRTPDAP
jgi:hypothetical protein